MECAGFSVMVYNIGNMNEKEILKNIKQIKKFLKKEFGLKCKKLCIDCPECNAMVLDAYLDWLEDSLKPLP
jgi:hypothetical protein